MVSIKTITKFIFVVCLGHYSNRNDCCSIVSHLQDYIPPIESIKPVDAIIIYIKTYIIPIITHYSHYCVLGGVLFVVVFSREYYNGITTITELS